MQSRIQIERRFRRARAILFLVWAMASAAVVFSVVYSASKRAELAIRQEAGETLSVQSQTLAGILDKYRLMAPLLARQSSVASLFVLNAEDNPQAVDARRMASWLTGMSAALDVAFLFPDGRLLGHANGPFVTTRTGLEELTEEASQGLLGRAMLSLGPELRSYAFSSGVRRNGRLVGIVIVYVDFYRIEAAWALSNRPIFVTDQDGTVVLSNVPEWRMTPVTAFTSREQAFLNVSRNGDTRRQVDLSRDLPVLGWRLHVLADPAPIVQARVTTGAIATLACLLAGLVAVILLRRFETSIISRRAERANALRLERIVRDRTRALSASNASLSHEVEVRREAEVKLRAAQAELIQAAKLAALGQMSAAISHEYNQPLAAIRSYADNGQRFLELGKPEKTRENLVRINGLVDRMAELSRTLLSFARRPGQAAGPVHLGTVIEEALLLARPRARKAGVAIELAGGLDRLSVRGGRVRLGQVFVNLVNNAVDALSGTANARITISARKSGKIVAVTVADNGPGVPEDQVKRIFDPFYTTKATGEGIGIGLAICDNIVRDFGGRIFVANRPEGGAVFTVELAAADPEAEVADAALAEAG